MAVVTFTTPLTNNATVDITSGSITETFSAAWLIFTRETSDSADNLHGVIGVGFVAPDGTAEEEACIGVQMSGDETATPDANSTHSVGTAPNCIRAPTGTAITTVISAIYSASISGGVRLQFPIATVAAKCTAILFAGLTRASVNSATSSTVGVHEDVGDGTQYRPDVLAFISSDGSINTASIPDAAPNLGFAVNGGAQVSSYINVDDGTEPTDADGYIRSASAWAAAPLRSAGALTIQHASVAFSNTGFTATANAGTPDAAYCALKFSGVFNAACANMAVAASTGNQVFTGFGFVPDLVFGMSTLLAAVDTTTDGPTASACGYFVTGSLGSRAYTVHHREGVSIPADIATSDAHTRQEDVALLLYDHTGTVVQRATWGGASGSNGFILNFSVASQVGFLTAIGIQFALAPRALSETEEISDSPVLFLNRALALTETVEISDLFASFTNNVSETDGPAGTSFSARAERGTSFQGGAEAGTAF